MDETDLDVHASQSENRRHWEVLGPFPRPAGAGKSRDTCCEEAGRRRQTCPGSDDRDSATHDGRRRRKEMCGTSS